ncbi:two-component system sensor histidine kinase NtrB [Robertmurraya korlensis]|uniref:two-component system sensor histidine kinase NtrB n=1 Tax=Robertmurraya korlensis TaxID=519977 RepID=UPI0008256C46|nr:ATP-binding protein [Robertmurraya korlensis]
MHIIEQSFQTCPFPFFVVDQDLTILAVSDESQIQFPNVGNFLELVDLGSRKKAERFLKPVFSKTKVELNLVRKDFALTLFDVYTQWEDENRLYVFCIEKQESIQQIQTIIRKLETELESENLSLLEKQEQLEATLKRMEQVVMKNDNLPNIGKMASIIARDLKKPLVSIRGFLQLLKPHLIETGKDHYADIALEEIDYANKLIYEYVSATQPTAPNKQQVNIQKVLMEVIQTTQKEAAKIKCEIKYVKEQILPVQEIDPKQLKQVVLNLLRNAMDAIQVSQNRGKGSIILRTRLNENTIEISVKDNGSGMEEDTAKRIFTPFYTTKEKGAGIGLSVCQKIVENHGGIIDVSSKPGEGTTFILVLPLESY